MTVWRGHWRAFTLLPDVALLLCAVVAVGAAHRLARPVAGCGLASGVALLVIGRIGGVPSSALALLALACLVMAALLVRAVTGRVGTLARSLAAGAAAGALAYGLAAMVSGVDVAFAACAATSLLAVAIIWPRKLGRRRMLPASLAGLGWMGGVGWWLDAPELMRGGVYPVPIPPQAALAFVLLALALSLLERGRARAALLAGLPCVALGMSPLLADYAGTPDVVTGWLEAWLHLRPDVAHGVLSHNLAVCTLLCAVALIAGVLARRRAGWWSVVWVCGLLITALGILSGVGIVFGGVPLNLFASPTPVSVPSALGMIALGLGLVLASPRSPRESRYRTLVFPAAMGLGVMLASVLLWVVLEQQQQQLFRQAQENQRKSVATALRDGMQAQVTAIRRMAVRVSFLEEPDLAPLFAADAREYLNDFAGLRALALVDSERVLRFAEARPGSPLPRVTRVDATPERRVVFDRVDATGQLQLSAPTRLLLGGRGDLIVAPVRVQGRITGYVVGVVEFDQLFPALLAAQAGAGNLRILQGAEPVYQRGVLDRPLPGPAPVVPLFGQQWQVELHPPLPPVDRALRLLMALGFALGGLLAVALRLLALARERAQLARAVSGELRDQIEVREAVQAALADVERDMIAVLESISDGVFMVRRDWRFSYVNAQAARLFDASPAALRGDTCWQTLAGAMNDGDTAHGLQHAWERALQEGGPVSVEAAHRASGRFYELRAYPHARGLTVYLHDVTERKQQERELLKRDAASRHAQQLARMGSWELHLRTGYLHWSAEACAIFGVDHSPGEEGMEALRQRVHPEDWPALLEDQVRLDQGEGLIDRQYRMIRPDGAQRVIRALGERLLNDGDPLVAGAVQDITEQQQAEAALRRTRDELAQALEATQLVMDSAPDVIIVLDRDGRFRRVSAAAERLWGFPPESLLGESMARLIHPDDRDASFAAVAAISRGEANLNFRNRNITRDGHTLYMQWSGVWSEQAQCLYVVGRDHTELHRVEQLEAAQRGILTAIASGRPLEEVLELIVRAYESQHPDALCSILLVREGRLCHGAAPHLPRQYIQAIEGVAVGADVGSCGTAAWRGERVIVTDIATDPLWERYAAAALPHGLLACWSTPIRARTGQVLGTFAVYYGQSRGPSDAELAGVEGLAANAAIAIEHEQAYQQLSDSEQRFRSLFDHHPDGVFALGVDGRVLQANAAAAALLGETLVELHQRALARYADPADRERVEAALAAAAAGEPERLELSVCDSSGNRFPGYLVTLPIVVAGQSRGSFAVLQDHRELHRAQQATASQLALLSAVADSVGEGLLAVDAAGVPTFLNRTAARLLELPAYGLPRSEAIPEAAHEVLRAILSGSGYAGSDDACFVLGEERSLAVAYVATPLRIEGRLAGAVLAFRDIGDIKEARRSLHERQRFFEMSLEVFCIFDASSGRFVQVNSAFCRLLGMDEAALLSLPLGELLHPQDRMATEDAIGWQRQSGEPMTEFVNRMRRADGEYVWLEWTSRQSTDGLIYAVARDVTAKRQAAMALDKAMDDLRIRNRELQDFAYVASHDLQEPLRKIQAFSDRLQSRLAERLDESSRDYLQRMGDAASRMQTLIDDLLAYSRVGTHAATPAAVDLARELATVLDDLDGRVQEAAATVTADPLPTIQADASQMRQLLQNLLANALKFRAADRPCRIHVAARPLGEQSSAADRWELRVEDNGIGFDPIYAERIFAPFQRLHPRNVYSGTGIGLAIVRRIVERHGGSIHAESRAGEGTSFVVTLPARAAASLARAAEDAPLMPNDTTGASS
ncbi:PAS domain S-box protein [Dyella sp.]|uniref:PAS domain S-box protein n=1 Tax=Dyella sp. TaxID=1869338 RepID=UPI002D77F5DE|nr:PAS domain S-box protein [Dyella sp.]HET6433062.1 PAS domain S-box protein [Dyella sp.]